MSFWDGYRWVDQTRARQTAPGSRMQDWFVTLVMLAAFAIATVPLLAVGAASATMSVNPSQAAPGQSVALTGTGFSPRTKIQLLWDGSTTGMPTPSVTGQGAIKASLRVPATAPTGIHTIGAAVIHRINGTAHSDQGTRRAPSVNTPAIASAATIQKLTTPASATEAVAKVSV